MGFASLGQALVLIPFLPHPNCAGEVHGLDKPMWAVLLGHWGDIGAMLLKKAQAFVTVCAIVSFCKDQQDLKYSLWYLSTTQPVQGFTLV